LQANEQKHLRIYAQENAGEAGMSKFDRRNRRVFPDPEPEPPLTRQELDDMEEDKAEYLNDLKRDRKEDKVNGKD
jgi:hypothetical protein